MLICTSTKAKQAWEIFIFFFYIYIFSLLSSLPYLMSSLEGTHTRLTLNTWISSLISKYTNKYKIQMRQFFFPFGNEPEHWKCLMMCIWEQNKSVMHMDYRPFGRHWNSWLFFTPKITVSSLTGLTLLIFGLQRLYRMALIWVWLWNVEISPLSLSYVIFCTVE